MGGCGGDRGMTIRIFSRDPVFSSPDLLRIPLSPFKKG
jgi:hypothetical protein